MVGYVGSLESIPPKVAIFERRYILETIILGIPLGIKQKGFLG